MLDIQISVFFPMNSDEIQRNLTESLKAYDPNLSISDLTLLDLRGRPRDTSNFYKHNNQNLYLRKRFVHDKESQRNVIEWTDVTKDYDWDKLMANPELTMLECKKQFSCGIW